MPLPTVRRRGMVIFVDVLGRHERVIEVLLLCTSRLCVSGLPLGLPNIFFAAKYTKLSKQ